MLSTARLKSDSACAFALVAIAFAGCGTPSVPPPPIVSAEKSASDFTSRSLRSPELHRFLQENLGRDPGDQWDFEALAWAAFYFHPSLELARVQWASARVAEQNTQYRPNPNLTISPGYNFTREPGVSPWMPAVNFDFLFQTGAKGDLQQSIAASEAEAAKLAVLTAAWQVRTELRRALSDAWIAGRHETQLKSQAEIQRSLVALLEQRQALGGISITEVSVARTALLKIESSWAESVGQALVARTRVAVALGLPASAVKELELPPPPVPAALSSEMLANAQREALRSRADVLTALAKYRSAHTSIELEIAKRIPDIHLGPGYQWDQGANKWSLGFGFEIPLFHRNEAGITSAVAQRAEAAAQFNVVQSAAVAAIDLAASALQAAQVQLEHAHRLHGEVQKQFARAQQRVEVGAADQVELQTARLEVSAAESAELDAEIAAAVAGGQLEDALQIPFPHFAALAATPDHASR